MAYIDIFPYETEEASKTRDTDGFMYVPDYGLSHKVDANIITQQFGDGYEQRIPMGKSYITHTISPTWSNMEWNYVNNAELDKAANRIYKFLQKRLKLTPFKFRDHPDSEDKIYTCEELTYTLSRYGLASISATFKEYKGAL